MLILSLPWPPSVNRYWRSVNGRVLISREGRAYRRAVEGERMVQAPQHRRIDMPVAVTISAHPPDRRRRDIDNVLKALLDSLQSAGVFADDSQIDRLTIERASRVDGGRVLVGVEPIMAT